ncbi:hypothetical protein HMPREF0208_03894 [Citrobacter koseri]|nr:hypothetical protein HMPREF0208_03894 [Citrobacter koseri]
MPSISPCRKLKCLFLKQLPDLFVYAGINPPEMSNYEPLTYKS